MKIDSIPQPTTDIYAMKGEFSGVTYFMTTLSLSECREQLHVENTNEVKTFRERIQRTLDKDRAQEICEKYLKKHQLRFFNSLVAVLVPAKGKNKGYYEFKPFSSDSQPLPFGILKIATSIQRVVVDGQHRLTALKYAEDYSRQLDYDETLRIRELNIPVVFLVFPETGGEGFNNIYEDIDKKIGDNARRIFVDLNKNAKKADKKTLYILDDSDFSAVAARQLIESNTDFELFTRWHGNGTTLSDSDHCFTTIEILDFMVQNLLGELEEIASSRYDLTADEEREEALQKYFFKPANNSLEGLSVSQFLDAFFFEIGFFDEWKAKIREILGSDPTLQPAPQTSTLAQRRSIKELRQGSLLATVIGQKVAFKAILEAFPHFPGKTGSESLHSVLSRFNKLLESGLYDRKQSIWDEFLLRAGSKIRINAEIPSATLLRALLERTPAAAMAPRFQAWFEEGVGTSNTPIAYEEALKILV
ncbi:hypothetical protein CFB52_000025 [Burkholderia sp. AU18528]|uniref:DGQHR domain-containing protein n=1 Tax=Burkholderia TaxID=32008 RepID=UPI000C088869|nr:MULTISPECIES: DNA sulfur modification protein DndB [Burkholderia]MDF3113103.1 DGQHR domain-containing protein [Burkholderia semiarida]PHP91267.1 hypothetical protein CFB52_000025 [Burkholderia sp. AU18528]